MDLDTEKHGEGLGSASPPPPTPTPLGYCECRIRVVFYPLQFLRFFQTRVRFVLAVISVISCCPVGLDSQVDDCKYGKSLELKVGN